MKSRRAFLRRLGAVGLAASAGCAGAHGRVATEPGGSDMGGPTRPATASTTATGDSTGTPTGGRVVDVAVGPEGRLRFVPDTLEVAVGDAVRWTFESAGHNVTSKPGASEKVRNPPGAEPFASYEGNRHYAVAEVGSTFVHRFAVAGEYVYVCEPHADQGMVGTVVVA